MGINNEMAIVTYLSIVTLNISGLSAPMKKHGVAEVITKLDPYMFHLHGTHFR